MSIPDFDKEMRDFSRRWRGFNLEYESMLTGLVAALRDAYASGAAAERERCRTVARERAEAIWRRRVDGGRTSLADGAAEDMARRIQQAIDDGPDIIRFASSPQPSTTKAETP